MFTNMNCITRVQVQSKALCQDSIECKSCTCAISWAVFCVPWDSSWCSTCTGVSQRAPHLPDSYHTSCTHQPWEREEYQSYLLVVTVAQCTTTPPLPPPSCCTCSYSSTCVASASCNVNICWANVCTSVWHCQWAAGVSFSSQLLVLSSPSHSNQP